MELLPAASRLQNEKSPPIGGPLFILGVPTGIRTPVIAVKGRCPRPLDDGDCIRTAASVGGGKRDRTADLLHAMQALSQLSYTPDRARNYISPRPLFPVG